MTFGDVLIVVAGLAALVATLWTGTLVFALLFPRRAHAAGAAAADRPAFRGLVGFALALVTGLLFIPFSKLGGLAIVGWVMLGVMIAVAVLGSAGLSLLVSERIRGLDSAVRPLPALGKASLLLIGSGLIPVVGWFALFPAYLFVSLGAGIAAVFDRGALRPEPVAVTPPPVPLVAPTTNEAGA